MSSIEEKVIAEIRERAKKGKAKYGTTMDRNDLTLKEWMQHLKEELMDGVIYTQKIIDIISSDKRIVNAKITFDDDACDTE
tara:strand:+ start:945 stop:1187 length:243 start_codon:yes stop_codon:yes gene_type:complete